MQKIKKYLFSLEAIVVFALLLLYFFTAPTTVQSGDTGELVTNSYHLRVSHPPGYPLWTLLYHLPLRYLPFSTPFHVASLFTAVISLVGLGLLLFRFKNKESLSLVLILATSLIFWRYSILPDVFSLHVLFLVLVFLVFCDPRLLDKLGIIFLISLSITNHHTILFVFPMYLWSVFKGNIKKKIFYSLIFGILSFGLYFPLMFFHPQEYGSWGYLTSFENVVNHFLRKEYGTFKLVSSDKGGSFVWMNLFLGTLVSNFWGIIVALLYLLIKGRQLLLKYASRFGALFFCFIAYLATFHFGGVDSLDGIKETIFERFLLQPLVLLVFILLTAVNLAGLQFPRWLLMVLIVNAGTNLTQNFSLNNYRKNTIIEDFALNALNSLPEKSIYYSHGDIQGGATYYVHDVLKVRPDVVHFLPNLTFPWGIKKASEKYPHALKLSNPTLIENVNLEDFSFFTNLPPTELPEFFKATFFGIIFKVEKSPEPRSSIGYQCNIIDSYSWRSRSDESDFYAYEVSRIYDLEYGRCHFTFGLELIKANHLVEARAQLEKAVELSRYSAKFLERLCYLYKSLNDVKYNSCIQRLDYLIAVSNRQYYLYKYGD